MTYLYNYYTTSVVAGQIMSDKFDEGNEQYISCNRFNHNDIYLLLWYCKNLTTASNPAERSKTHGSNLWQKKITTDFNQNKTTYMDKTIMIVGHPYWKDSVANKAIVEEFLHLNPGAVISNISELYPDGNINAKAEQEKLLEADNIVLQFPIMWYSCPSNMHKWMETVLTYGFAYGHGGDKLKGKRFIVSFTSGGSADMYSRYGVQKMTIDDLMSAFVGIPNYCGMQWGGYVFSGGMMTADNTDEEQLATLRGRTKDHARRLTNLIQR